ncbi:MAG TPA: diacylglycerol kinase, partial [Burkholderiaceae bacterium]|nr:diacylglycerol kinase [Burkholderiaceae bacterium]
MNPHKSKAGLTRIWRAFFYSHRGLRDAWRHEHAFRQELALALALTPVIVLVPVSLPERAALAASLLLVLIVELLNSAIEAVVDRVSLEPHELSGRAKDMASAAVMLSLVLAGVTWVAVLFPAAR